MLQVVTDGALTGLPSSLDTHPAKYGYYMERTICQCDRCSYLVTFLAIIKAKKFHCDNQAVVDIWKKALPGPHRPWLWSVCCIFVQLTTTLMYALCTYQVYVMILLILSLISRWTGSGS